MVDMGTANGASGPPVQTEQPSVGRRRSSVTMRPDPSLVALPQEGSNFSLPAMNSFRHFSSPHGTESGASGTVRTFTSSLRTASASFVSKEETGGSFISRVTLQGGLDSPTSRAGGFVWEDVDGAYAMHGDESGWLSARASQIAALDSADHEPIPRTRSTMPGAYTGFITTTPSTTTVEYELITFRRLARQVLASPWSETFMGAVILFNMVLICLESDKNASALERGVEPDLPFWLELCEHLCFGIYTTELFMRILADKRRFFRKGWNIMDVIVVLFGLVDYILVFWGLDVSGSLGIIRALRLVRLVRLVRILRLFYVMKELKRLIQMMGGCFKTLFWSCILLFLVMTIWAIIAVEVVNPVIQELADKGTFSDCPRCRSAFSSVFKSDVTFFQTVVAGDSWGDLAVPVIEHQPLLAIVFVGSLMTLVFGVLNLIVAVIVDVFAENREKDVLSRANDLEEDEREQKAVLGRIFQKIDTDNSGSLSFEELIQGAYKVAEFNRWLRVLDIDSRDLEQLFRIVDADGNGEIDPIEFIEAMYRIKTTDSKTATKLVKHIVARIDEDNQELKASVQEALIEVKESTEEISRTLEETLMDHLREQERAITETIEMAVRRAAEVAMSATPGEKPDLSNLNPMRPDPSSLNPMLPSYSHLPHPPIGRLYSQGQMSATRSTGGMSGQTSNRSQSPRPLREVKEGVQMKTWLSQGSAGIGIGSLSSGPRGRLDSRFLRSRSMSSNSVASHSRFYKRQASHQASFGGMSMDQTLSTGTLSPQPQPQPPQPPQTTQCYAMQC